MNKPIIYSLEQIRSFDVLNGWNDSLIGLAFLAQTMFGTTGSFLQGFVGTQTVSPSLTINLGQGFAYAQSAVDSTSYGALNSNSMLVTQQGYYAGGTITFSPTIPVGQSLWALVQIGFAQADSVRVGDPTNGVLPYVNVQNPSQPLQGQNGNGQAQNTVRSGTAVISIKYGTPAVSSPVPPTPDANSMPLYLINLTHGQTAITNGEINVTGPGVYSGYQVAPLFPGVTGQVQGASGGSHHGGIAGQAAKILLSNGAEVTGLLPLANLPVTNTNPPATGGSIVQGGEIPVLTIATVIPTGNIAGNRGDLVFDSTLGLMYLCTMSGTSGTAVWTPINNTGVASVISSFPLTPAAGQIYLCDTSAGVGSVTFSAASTYGGLAVTIKNLGPNQLQLFPNGSETLETDFTFSAPYIMNAGDSIKLAPVSGTGWYIIQ